MCFRALSFRGYHSGTSSRSAYECHTCKVKHLSKIRLQCVKSEISGYHKFTISADFRIGNREVLALKIKDIHGKIMDESVRKV